MKIFLTSLIVFFSCCQANAQQNRFIYLQTENRKPFFAKLDNKIINSSLLGYLIIPKLDDGLYSIVIGFPESTYEQEFNCSIKNKDVGFLIKNSGGMEWQLINVQTNAVIVPGDVSSKPVINYEKETDPFSTMLANAVNDSTILRKDVIKEIFTENTNVTIDTTRTTVLNNDIAVIKRDNNLAIDSNQKDIAKVAPVEKTHELNQPDTANKIITTTDVAINVSDSTKKDISKEIYPEKHGEIASKDSSGIAIPNEAAVIKPENILNTDSLINKEIAKVIITEKPVDVTKDSVQFERSNDVAITKSKKKKAKKNDNALKDSVQQQETVKVIPEKVIAYKDTTQSVNKTTDIALRSVIKRRSKKTSRDGLEMMYIDDNGDTKDTIRILIPSEKKKKNEEALTVTDVTVHTIQQGDKAKEDEKKKSDYKITEKEKEIIKEANSIPQSKLIMINSDCKSFANDEDFLKIRKRMVAESNDEDMIKAARKIFKTKCFTTEQVKNLSVLFLKDQGKYLFFNTAYAFVSDSEQYYTLEKQLTDNTYIKLFRSMINK